MSERAPLELAGPPAAVNPAGDGITFIGTATTLIQAGGFTLLTDPNFLHRGDRAYVGLGLSTRRRTEPALSPAQLPPLDAIVLSHHHGDHFDRIAAAELDHDLPVITNAHAARKLRSQGFRAPVALANWETQVLRRGDAELRVTSLPGKHAPEPLGFVIPPVMGILLDFSVGGERRLRLYITGDTLFYEGIVEIARRCPDIDLCVIHLGGTRIAGVLLTMDGRQGAAALRVVAPRAAIPVHYDDYTLFRSPLADFRREAERTGLPTEIHYLDRGERHPLQLDVPAR